MNKQRIFNTGNYLILGILLLTFIVFAGSLNNGFTNWDDDVYIYNNFLIRAFSVENLQKIFLAPMGDAQIYRPMAYLTYMIDFQLWGLEPFGYHLSSLLFHLVNIILVFQIVKLLSNNLTMSALVALCFAINPLKVEAVTWAAARVDVVYSFFYLGALLSYVAYTKSDLKLKYLVLATFLFAFSLLSKPSAVTFPIACLLVDFFMARKWSLRILLEKTPLFLLAFAMGVITLLAQRPDTVSNGIAVFSIVERFFIVCYMPLFYLFKSIFPFALSNYYEFPKELSLAYYISPLLLAGIVFLVYRARNNKAVLFGVAFFLLHLALVLNLIPTGNKFMAADRYAYLAQIGLFFMLAYLYTQASSQAKNIYLSIFGFLLLVHLVISYKRTQVWENGAVLWADAVMKDNNCSFCLFGLGNIMINSGEQKAALPYIEKSIALNPMIAESYHSRGIILFALKDYQNAIKDFDKTLSLNPTYQYSYASRGSTYASIKEYDKAMQDFQKALNLNPNDIETYLNRGMVRGVLKDYAGAKTDLDVYLSYYPDNPKALYNRGYCNAYLGNITGCCGDWKRAYDKGMRELAPKLREYCGYKNL
ncbi:MAG: tetratricopeptide repeat protein [Cytophagales bacterium]|nr:MAG: tetratricopeptide repeat protein [Cytophagales bacterium]